MKKIKSISYILGIIVLSTSCTKENISLTPEQIGQSVYEAYKENNFENTEGLFATKEDIIEIKNRHYEYKLSKNEGEEYNLKAKEEYEREIAKINKEGYMDDFYTSNKEHFLKYREEATTQGIDWEKSEITEIQTSEKIEKDGNEYINIIVVFKPQNQDIIYKFKLKKCFNLRRGLVISHISGVSEANTLNDGNYKFYHEEEGKYKETIKITVYDGKVKSILIGETLKGDKIGWENTYTGTIEHNKINLSGTLEVEGTEREIEETWIINDGNIQRNSNNKEIIYNEIYY